MPKRERVDGISRAALEYRAAHALDAHPVARAHCAAFAEAQGCRLETARKHLTRAVSYHLRGAEAVPPGWGGVRPGAGRKPASPRRERGEE